MGVDYPPTRTYRLGTAREAAAERITECEARVDDLEDDDDATAQALAEARQDAQAARTHHKGLTWAVDGTDDEDGFGGWGADADLTVQAHTFDSRSRALDARDRLTAGPVGARETRTWLIAGSIVEAPWLDGDEDLATEKQLVGQLPPMFVDWLDHALGELNDLTEGN